MPISEVLNMDCMEGMKSYPDNFFDLAIVDPPYGLGDDKLTSGGTWAAKYKKGDAAWDIAPDPSYFIELFRISKNQIIWGGNYFELPRNRCFIVWDKISHLPTMADCEYAWTSFDKNAKIFPVLRAGNQTTEDRIHINQKPVKLYRKCLHHFAEPGNKILDTHLGSGSSRIAAFNMNFDFWGFELNTEYYEDQEKRFKEQTMQGNLFT